jgi:CHAD domain-containing protein
VTGVKIAGRTHMLVLSADDTAGAAARAVVAFHLRTFMREEAGARAGEVEPVHQLRVATRRLRATLRLFAPVLPAGTLALIGTDLAWLGREIGGVRDLDVFAEAVKARGRSVPPALRRALEPLEDAIRERRVVTHGRLLEALDGPRRRALLTRLSALGAAPAKEPHPVRLGDMAPDLIAPVRRAMVDAGRRLDGKRPDAEALHQLRVRVKRLRYALETLRGLGGRKLTKTLGRLERLQDFLGEHQDAVTQITWLRAWAETAAAPPATLMAAGALVQELMRRARRRRRRFSRAWARVDHRGLDRGLTRELGRGVRGRPRVLRVVRSAAS